MPSGVRIWNIEKAEQQSVLILLVQSIFLGIFAGAFDVGAHSIFLNVFEASLIPKAYVVTGFIGVFITSLYVRLQNRMKFSDFALLNLIFVVIITSLLRLGFEFTREKWLVFATFVMMGPLTIISFLGFWGTVSRIFNLRQGKRLFGLIDTGQILGIIISSFAIPILITLKFRVLNSLIICSVSIFLALIMQVVISRNFNLETAISGREKVSARSNMTDLFRNKYTMLLALFVAMSVLTAFFVHFSFLSVLKENYPDPDTRATFFGAFMGALAIFTIIVKTFVFDKLIKTYGLKVTLMLSPILIGIFTLIASLTGSIYGFTIASASFAFFFLLIALSKLFAKSLKDSIEVPSSKILYQSLDANIRYDVQARIDGTVNELAALSSGLILFGLGLIASVKLIHFSYFLLIIVFFWIIIAVRLYKAYKNSLGISLRKFRQSAIDLSESVSSLDKIIPQENERKMRSFLQLAPQTWNGYILKNLAGLLHSGKELRYFTLSLIEKFYLFETDQELAELQKSVSGPEKKWIDRILNIFRISGKDLEEVNLRNLLVSNKPEDRKKGLLVILKRKDSSFYPRVVPLFRDPDHSVRICAIRTAGLIGKKDYVTYLIDLLEDAEFYSFAFNALCSMGDNILESLENGFYKTHISEKGLIRITRVMGRIGTPLAAAYLMNRLDHNNRRVITEAIRSLMKINAPLVENDKAKVFETLNKIVGTAAWNLAALHSARQHQLGPLLIDALNEELSDNYDLIFGLLSIAYDPQSIYHIRKSIESGTSESIGFAIELLDLFIDENIKTYLFPLFDDTGLAEKIGRLQSEFPVDIYEPVELLINIINRDSNRISVYSKVCALQILGKTENYKLSNDIVAQMFNQEPILREVASEITIKLDSDKYSSVIGRLPLHLAAEIENFMKNSGRDHGELKKFELLRKSGLLDGFKKHDQLELAKGFELLNFIPTGENNTLISKLIKSIFLLLEGELEFKGYGKMISIKEGSLVNLPERIPGDEYSIHFKGREIVIMTMKKSLLQELIFDDENSFLPLTEILQNVNDNINESIKVNE